MSKVLLLVILVLCLNTTATQAADGLCAALLGAQNSKNDLGNYLNELFREGVVTERELTSFRDGLLRGERINPIVDPDLDISRYVAFERVSDFLDKNPDLNLLAESVNSLLSQYEFDSETIKTIEEEVSGVLLLVEKSDRDERKDLIQNYFSKPESVKAHKALRLLIELEDEIEIGRYVWAVFLNEHWVSHPELLKLAMDKTLGWQMGVYAKAIFSSENWVRHPELLKHAIQKTPVGLMQLFGMDVFSKEYWSGHPELLRLAIEKTPAEGAGDGIFYFLRDTFSTTHWLSHPELVRYLIEKMPPDYMTTFGIQVFSQPQWSKYPELLRLAIEKTPIIYVDNFKRNVFSKPHWADQSVLRDSLDIKNPSDRALVLRQQLGRYPWEGTEQENLKEYLNRLYGRIDE